MRSLREAARGAFLIASTLLSSTLIAAEVRLEARIFVEVQNDGKHCLIGKADVLCAELLPYLRETLSLRAGTPIGVKAGRAAPYKQVKAVLEQLRNSEFSPPVAVVTEPAKPR